MGRITVQHVTSIRRPQNTVAVRIEDGVIDEQESPVVFPHALYPVDPAKT